MHYQRNWLAPAAVVCTLAAVPVAAQTKTFDIPAQPAVAGLRLFSRQADVQILSARRDTRSRRTNAVRGELTIPQALGQLLSGTGLEARQTDRQTYTVMPARETGPLAATADDAKDSGIGGDADIIVTATKREERLREVAGGISAQTNAQLHAIGAQDFKDYLTRVPGVQFNEGRSNLSTVIIRGVGTSIDLGEGQGETGYFINEIPLSEAAYTLAIPDVDTFDVNRVEVLRGPQGTLFGSASLGGAINYITRLADTGKIDAAAETGLSTVDHGGGELGYMAKAMVNVPIVDDKLAARIAVSQRVDAGYINNPTAGEKGSNDVHNLGIRGSIVFTPAAGTKISYLGFYNRTRTDDISYSQLQYGPLQHRLRLQPEMFKTIIQSLRLDQQLGTLSFTGIGAYSAKRTYVYYDYDAFYGYLNPGQTHTFIQRGRSDNWSFEGRLASATGGRFDWLLGAMAMTTKKQVRESLGSPGFAAYDPADAVEGDVYYVGLGRYKGNERALFGEGNLHFGDLILTAGGRLFHTELTVNTSNVGPVFFGPDPVLEGPLKTSQSGFAPKVSAKYQFSPDAMVYALASKGYRFGTPNSLFAVSGIDIPAGTKTDSLWNYEVGTRLDVIKRKLLLDVSSFYIDWNNIQTRFQVPGQNLYYGANAGSARIKGVEASLTLNLGRFSYVGNATYLDAKINETLETTAGMIYKGQTLPGAAKWRLSNTASYNFGGTLQPTITLMHRYVAKSPAYLTDPTIFGAFNVFDARAAATLGRFEIAAYVKNIGNTLGETFGNQDQGYGPLRYYIRPRTIGLQLDWKLRP